MNVKIKICGLRRREDIISVNKYLPDYAGFVFYKKSSRYITPDTALELKSVLSPAIRAVGVFVDEPADNILDLCDRDIIDIIQLHGNESTDFIKHLKSRTDKPIIRALRVHSAKQLEEAADIPCDYLLLDTFISPETYGGTGRTFDRKLIPENYRPFFLAGGLNAENVTDAIKECRPYAVDLSSSVESIYESNGKTERFKDDQKIKEIIGIIRAI